MKLAAVIFILTCFPTLGAPLHVIHLTVSPSDIIPSSRRIDWSPGFVGTIPTYPTSVNVKSAPYNATGDGVTDDWTSISNAVANCAAGGAVYFPNGTYRITKGLNLTSGIVFRGQDPTNTVIVCERNTGDDSNGEWNIGTPYTTGATYGTVTNLFKGSNSFTGVIASGLGVGSYIKVYQDNDTGIVLGGTCATPLVMSQMFMVTNIVGNTITVDRPAYFSWTNQSLHPTYIKYPAPVTNSGLESFTLSCKGTTTRGIFYAVSAQCWMNDVTVTNSGEHSFCFEQCYHCTVRRCKAMEPQRLFQSRYGFQIANGSTDNLIEDNFADGGSSGFLAQQGSAGNVFGYNYVYRGFVDTPPPTLDQRNGLVNHGFSCWNLWEGNLAIAFSLDCFWGNNDYNTAFRNWLRRRYPNEYGNPITHFIYTVAIQQGCHSNNIVGNVLNEPQDLGIDQGTTVWDINNILDSNDCNGIYYADSAVVGTTIFGGNFEWAQGTTTWTNTIARSIPSSCYLTNKPSWFSTLAWPPFGPDVPVCLTVGITNAVLIPSQARFLGVAY